MADSNARVEDGKIVIIHFTLTDSDGVMIETSVGDEPLPYLHGADNIVDGLEAALDGGAVGDKLSVDLTPADAYGEATGTPEQAVPRDEFPDGVPLEAGMELFTEGSEGEPIPLWITRFDDDSVWITLDHPLAGKDVRFDVEIVGIREPTGDELEHGHPHGVDGDEGHGH